MTLQSDDSDRLSEHVLAEWKDEDTGKLSFLGDTKDATFQMTVRLDTQSKPELVLWFHVVVRVKRHPQSTNPRPKTLFFVIQANMFDHDSNGSCFTLEPVSSLHLTPTTICALSNANLGPLDGISRLQFKLGTCGNVLMPKSDAPLTPASDKARDLLLSLRSLSKAKAFCIYIPLKEQTFFTTDEKKLPCEPALKELCELVVARKMVTHKIDFEAGYKDGAEWDAWGNFDLSGRYQKMKSRKQDHATAASASAQERERKPPSMRFTTQPFGMPPPGYEEATSTSAERVEDNAVAVRRSDGATIAKEIDLDGEETQDEVQEAPMPNVESAQRDGIRARRQNEPTNLSMAQSGGNEKGREKKRRPSRPLSDEDVEPSDEMEAVPPPVRARKHVRFHETSKQPHALMRSRSASLLSRSSSTHPATTSSTSPSLRKDLANFLVWLTSVDAELEERYEDVLWKLGRAANAGDASEFMKIRAECKADVLCRYGERRGR